MVESVLHGGLGDCPLPVVIYLDDIAIYGDTQEQVLEDTLEAIKQLAVASFMLNLHKSQLVQAAAQVLGHLWTSGSFWVPNVTKLTTLIEKLDGELARFNWASLYGLLNFYREYVPAFAKLVELLCQLLGQDAQLWMAAAGECICEVVQCIVTAPCWLNADLLAELHMETRVSSCGIATLLLQQHPDKPRTWTPMASWGCCLEPLEKLESCILLELKALHEGAWKMGKFMAFSQQLVMQVTLELCALLKVMHQRCIQNSRQCSLISNSTSLRGSWEVHLPCLKSWTLQAALWASGRMSQTSQLTWMLCTALSLP